MGKKQQKPGKAKENTEKKTGKADEKKARRESKKLSPEDDVDAILLSIQKDEAKKKEVHVEDNVPHPTPRSNCLVANIYPLIRRDSITTRYLCMVVTPKKCVDNDKSSSEKGIVHSHMRSFDPRTWEWNKVKKSGMPPGPRAGFSLCVHKKRAILFGGVVYMKVQGRLFAPWPLPIGLMSQFDL